MPVQLDLIVSNKGLTHNKNLTTSFNIFKFKFVKNTNIPTSTIEQSTN